MVRMYARVESLSGGGGLQHRVGIIVQRAEVLYSRERQVGVAYKAHPSEPERLSIASRLHACLHGGGRFAISKAETSLTSIRGTCTKTSMRSKNGRRACVGSARYWW